MEPAVSPSRALAESYVPPNLDRRFLLGVRRYSPNRVAMTGIYSLRAEYTVCPQAFEFGAVDSEFCEDLVSVLAF